MEHGEREQEIAETVDLLMDNLKDLLTAGDWPPTRFWIRPPAYEVRFIGPRWLKWLIRQFGVVVEVKEPPNPEDYKMDGLSRLVTTDMDKEYEILHDEFKTL
jgi:hypothetical protein